MRLASIRIEQFRCLRELDLSLDDVTILVGANGTGKSSVLYALNWLFRGGPLEPADLHSQADGQLVTVTATFTDLSDTDQSAFAGRMHEDRLIVRRAWSAAEGEEVTVTVPTYPPFAPLHTHTKATPFKQAYEQLQKDHPELPRYQNLDAGRQALTLWEDDHPDDLELMQVCTDNIFSGPAGARLAGRFDFVLVPAVADATQQARDARGTLLRRLLDRGIPGQSELGEKLGETMTEFNERLGELLASGYTTALETMEQQLSNGLHRYVAGASVTLEVQRPDLQAPAPEIILRVDDGGGLIDAGRQGHGVQRALLMTLVQQLAEPATVPDNSDPPALLLAIEEPELYQHPLQARHLARVLTRLSEHGQTTIQVAYVTHNVHFVDTGHFERLRRFSKVQDPTTTPSAIVHAATVKAISTRLEGVIPSEQVPWKVTRTLQDRLAEAVFAHAVLLVEGDTDAAIYRGVADRDPSTSLDATGVAIVDGHGRGMLPLMWAILDELGIPVYMVFDGDAGKQERMRSAGKAEQEIAVAVQQTQDCNRLLLRLLGEPEVAQPPTKVTGRYAVLRDHLETELEVTWPAMVKRARELAEAQARKGKNADGYYHAALETSDPPSFAREIIAAACTLANPRLRAG